MWIDLSRIRPQPDLHPQAFRIDLPDREVDGRAAVVVPQVDVGAVIDQVARDALVPAKAERTAVDIVDIGVGPGFDQQFDHVEVDPSLDLAPIDLLMRRTTHGEGQGGDGETAFPVRIVEGFMPEVRQRRVLGQHFGHEFKVAGIHGADPLFFLVKPHFHLPFYQ